MSNYLLAALMLSAAAVPPRISHASDNKEPSAAASTPPADQTRLVSANATGDLYRLVLKYEPVAAGQPTTLTVSLNEIQGGAPVTGAAVELRLVNAHAEVRPSLPPAAEPGTYSATITFPRDGDYETVAKVTRSGEIDLMRLDPVRVGALPGTAAGNAHVLLQQILLGAVVLFILGMLGLSLVSYRRGARTGTPAAPPPT